MGNSRSTTELRKDGDFESSARQNNLSWCDMNSQELNKIGIALGIANINLNVLNEQILIDLDPLCKLFPKILCRFYLGFFSFYSKNETGNVLLVKFLKCINCFLYSNRNGIINKMTSYLLSIINDEIEILRIILSIIHFELNFLLCGENGSSRNSIDKFNEEDYLKSLTFCFDFEFIILQYYKIRSNDIYSKLSADEAITDFIQEYLPLFVVLIRFAIRVHFEITSHPNSIQGAFRDKRKSMIFNNSDSSSPLNKSTPLICSKNKGNENCICTSDIFRFDSWTDSNSRILLTEHCTVLRCQYFGDVSSGEYLTLFQPWNVLYASWKHGLSLQRLVSSIQGYSSNVLLLIKTIDNCIFGAICSGDWKEGNGKFSGDETCFLFSLRPTFSIIRQTGQGRNFMYINTRYQFSPKGIGFGGEPEYSRLWLDPSLEVGTCMRTDLTYKNGMLYLPINNSSKRNSCLLLGTPYSAESDEATCEINKFSVSDIEVWGLGGFDIFKDYLEGKATNDYFKQERKVIDKSKFIKNEFDKEYLLANTYSKKSRPVF